MKAHVPSLSYGQYLTYAHNHITRAVAAMDSWLVLTGAHQLGIAVGSISGAYCLGECKHYFNRKLHRKHVVVVGGELQNSSSTACVWRWYQKNWPVCPNKFETIPINCIEAHVSTPRPVWPVPYACAQPWAPIRAKQLSMAATAGVIWLCACLRYWPYFGVGTCASVQLIGIVSKSFSQFKRLAHLNFWLLSTVYTAFIKSRS